MYLVPVPQRRVLGCRTVAFLIAIIIRKQLSLTEGHRALPKAYILQTCPDNLPMPENKRAGEAFGCGNPVTLGVVTAFIASSLFNAISRNRSAARLGCSTFPGSMFMVARNHITEAGSVGRISWTRLRK